MKYIYSKFCDDGQVEIEIVGPASQVLELMCKIFQNIAEGVDNDGT